MQYDLDFVRDLVVEKYGIRDEDIENHALVAAFKKAQASNDPDAFYEVLVRITIASIITDIRGELTPSSRFRKDLGADSLDLVELIMAFEELAGTVISDEEAMSIETVGDAVRLVRSRMESHKD